MHMKRPLTNGFCTICLARKSDNIEIAKLFCIRFLPFECGGSGKKNPSFRPVGADHQDTHERKSEAVASTVFVIENCFARSAAEVPNFIRTLLSESTCASAFSSPTVSSTPMSIPLLPSSITSGFPPPLVPTPVFQQTSPQRACE